jgi:hypothetical protein
MVSVRIISRFSSGFSVDKLNPGNRKIAGDGLYPSDELLEILKHSETVSLMTRDAAKDVKRLGIKEEGVAVLLRQALKVGQYTGSEWASINEKTCAACDVYRLQRTETVEETGYECSVEYYLKFAIGKTGQIVMVISCHLSQ